MAAEVRKKVLLPAMAPVHAERLLVEVPPADHEFIYIGIGPRIVQIERKLADHPVQFGGEGDVLLYGAVGVDKDGEAVFRGAVFRAQLQGRIISTDLLKVDNNSPPRTRAWWYEQFHNYARFHRKRIIVARLERSKGDGGYVGVPHAVAPKENR